MKSSTDSNTAKHAAFPGSREDRDAVVQLVCAARDANDDALTAALADPRMSAPLTPGSGLHILGAWHMSMVAERFGSAPLASRRFPDHVIDTADEVAACGQEATDERIRDLLGFWVAPPAGRHRSTVPATDEELTALAVSLAIMLRSDGPGGPGDAEVRRDVDAVADRVAAQARLPTGQGVDDRDWTDGAATCVTLIRRRKHGGKFVSSGYFGASERGGMLIDIAFHLGATDLPAMIDLTPSTVEFGPARRLLEAMSQRPSEPIEHWLGRGPTLADDLAEAWAKHNLRLHDVDTPERRRGYVDMPTHNQQVKRIEERFTAIAEHPDADPYQNAIAVVLGTTGMLWTGSYRSTPALLEACGPVAGLAFAVQEFMVKTRLLPPGPGAPSY